MSCAEHLTAPGLRDRTERFDRSQKRHTGAMSEFVPDPLLRGLLMGSGAGPADPGMARRIVSLTGKPAADVEVLYLGTATYDQLEPRERQCAGLAGLGCRITPLDVARRTPAGHEAEEALGRADVILASGGNTLYAMDRWAASGVDERLRRAAGQGVVICGGSAGAICWFDGGHSDSMDPTSYLHPVPEGDPGATSWRYLRVDGLGLLPGLVCPHFDRTQGNGVLRARDFEQMMLRHSGEVGLGLDNWAGLLIDGDTYEVVYPEGMVGSNDGGRFEPEEGLPGLWLMEVVDGAVVARLAPSSGRLGEILRPASHIDPDPMVAACRAANPGHAAAALR